MTPIDTAAAASPGPAQHPAPAGTHADHPTPGAPRPPLDEAVLDALRQVFHAARQGDAAHIAPLLAAGLPPNLRNDKGDSLLQLAAYHCHLPVVQLLLQHGADVELRNDKGQSPLGCAAFKGDAAIVDLLLQHGAQVDATGADGRTALMYAAMFNRVAMVQRLLQAGADPAARDAAGMTAGELAQKMGAADTAAALAPA